MKSIMSAPAEFVTIAILSGLILFFGIQNPQFLGPENIAVILRSCAFTGLCAFGISFLLISGSIDLSIGAIAGLASVTVASILAEGIPIVFSIAITLVVGGVCGLLNSVVIQKLKISAFLATISTMYIFRGLAMTVSKGYTIYPLPDQFLILGDIKPLGVSLAFTILITTLIIGEIILRSTVWGLTIKATGSDRETAKCTEVNVESVTTQMFILCGVFAALAGILLTARVQAGQPTMGQGWELNAIAAVAIGGVSLSGYEGNMFNVFLGVLLIQVLESGLVALGASAYLQPIEVGIILVFTATMDVRRKLKLDLRRADSER